VSSGVVNKIRELGGEIYAITSEPQTLASRAKEEWELSFDTIGDPHHEISDACRRRDWLDIYVKVDAEDFLQIPVAGMNFQATHPKGYFQAGVLVVDDSGQVLYRWKQVPTHSNLGGAVERPTAEHVWSKVKRKLTSDEVSKDATLDLNPKLDSKSAPWPIFICALLGNGRVVYGAQAFCTARKRSIRAVKNSNSAKTFCRVCFGVGYRAHSTAHAAGSNSSGILGRVDYTQNYDAKPQFPACR